MNFDVVLSRTLRLVVPAVTLAVLALAVWSVLDRLAFNDLSAERRALQQRADALTAGALTPGSALACLDAVAGEAAEDACEAAIFATPQSTAQAVALTAARLSLLADVAGLTAANTDAEGVARLRDSLAGTRRALERDRYGFAAQVLVQRDGCTPERCAGFALVADATTLKGNMQAQAYAAHVARHALAWNAAMPDATPAALPATPPAPGAMSQTTPPAGPLTAEAGPEPVARPLSSKYDFPSAASIPPVSIMGAEPALPKAAAEAQAAEFKADNKLDPKRFADAPAKTEDVPVPPKRPQALRDLPAAPTPLR